MHSLFASLIVFMTLGVTIAQTLLRQLGLEPTYLAIALGAVVFTYLVAHRTLLLLLIIAALTVLIQARTAGIQTGWMNQDILLVTLITLVILPHMLRLLGYEDFNRPVRSTRTRRPTGDVKKRHTI